MGVVGLSEIPLVGRGELLPRLAVELGEGANLLLEGGAGIGKTRLAAELVAMVEGKSRQVCRLFASAATTEFQMGAFASMGQPFGVGAGDIPGLFGLVSERVAGDEHRWPRSSRVA